MKEILFVSRLFFLKTKGIMFVSCWVFVLCEKHREDHGFEKPREDHVVEKSREYHGLTKDFCKRAGIISCKY